MQVGFRDSVRATVAQCLSRCFGSEMPVAHLAQFIDDLREQGWEESEIREVKLGVLPVLAASLVKQRAAHVSRAASSVAMSGSNAW